VVGFGVAESFLAMNEDDGLVCEGEPGRREFCGRVGEHLLQFSSARARHGGSLAEFKVCLNGGEAALPHGRPS